MKSVADEKKALRQRIISLRNQMDSCIISKADQRGETLASILLAMHSFRTVGLYWPKANEFPTGICAEVLLRNGIQLALPVVVGHEIEFYRYEKSEELVLGNFGINIPPVEPDRLVSPWDLDGLIIPGVAFDRRLFRLGWGKGYYDHFLQRIRPDVLTIGLAYEFQVLDLIPITESDQPVMHIFTEERSTLEKSFPTKAWED